MSGPIKGFPSKKRDLSLKAEEVYATGSPTGNDKHGLDVAASVFATATALAQPIDTLTDAKTFDSAGTTAKEGDILRFSNGAQARVLSVTGDTIKLGNLPDPALAGTETFDILTPNTPVVNADGELALDPGPIQFELDGSAVTVNEDTVTPANNRPLPVKLTDVTGDINITANDLNVQLEHTGANPDSVQIGDGTETLSITASGEAETSDATTHTKLDTLETTANAIETSNSSIDTKLSTTNSTLSSIDTELATKLDEATWTGRIGEVSATPTANTVLARLKDIDDALTTLNAEDFATETTLAALNAKVTAVDTTGKATEAKQDSAITELQQIEADIEAGNVTLSTIAGDTTSIDAKTPALGAALTAASTPVNIASDQTVPVSAASLPLPTGAATEATLASLAAEDFATQTTLAAVLTELQAKADLAETQPVSAASLPLPTGAATEAKQDSAITEHITTNTTLNTVNTNLTNLLTELQLKADLSETQPVSAASLPLPTGAATEATLSSIDGKVLSGNILASIDWDYTSLVEAATTDTWTFKSGGAGGSTTATVTITYTDSTKETISTVART